MYTIAVGVASGVLTAFLVGLRYNIYAMIFTGFLVGLGVFFLVSRHMAGKLQKLQEVSMKQLEGQKFDLAIRTLEDGFKFKRWMVMGESQLNALIGYVHYLRKDFDKAFPYLRDSFVRHWIAQAMLATCYYRRKDTAKMEAVLGKATKSNKKVPFLWGLHAYLVNAGGNREKALEILNNGVLSNPDDKALKENVLQLQNKKKLKMAKFGDVWYQLWLEPIPQSKFQAPQMKFSAFRGRRR